MTPCGSAGRSLRALGAMAVAATLILSTSLLARSPARSQSATPGEVRALWVLRTSLTSPASIATLVSSARDHGFNTLLVQVRGRGDAYFNNGIEPRATELQRQPALFDPLDVVLTTAHAAGLSVHAWVNLNLVSSAVDLPIAREHLVNRHPEWLMVPRELAIELAKIPDASPAYVGKLARWTRTRSSEVEGLYASPVAPGAVDYLASVVGDLVRRYPLDGVHFDYARYPGERFDYSRLAIAEFRAAVRPQLAELLRRRLDAAETVDLFAYPDALPDDWRRFRVARMTTLMRRLRGTVGTARPGAVVSVAVAPELREAYDHRLQDWSTWLQDGLVDVVCPMAYATDPTRFAEQIAAARNAAGSHAVWAGIGAYRLSPAQTVANIQTARRLGTAGVILFSYDSVSDSRAAIQDYLAQVGRAAFALSSSPPASH